jgi:hypothetical protein
MILEIKKAHRRVAEIAEGFISLFLCALCDSAVNIKNYYD